MFHACSRKRRSSSSFVTGGEESVPAGHHANAVHRRGIPSRQTDGRVPQRARANERVDVGCRRARWAQRGGAPDIGPAGSSSQESVKITKNPQRRLLRQPRTERRLTNCLEKRSNLHLFGIVSDAGVHGLLEHLYCCLEMFRPAGVPGDRVLLHAFTDGRDTSPNSGLAM